MTDDAGRHPGPPAEYPLFHAVTTGALLLFAAWTAVYWFVFALRLPVVDGLWLMLVVAILMGWAERAFGIPLRGRGGSLRPGPAPLAVVALGLVMAGVFLVTNRPDADDLHYFHRALYQLDHMKAPPAPNDHLFEHSGLYVNTLPHVLTSYEPAVAFIAAALRIEPLQVYHNVLPVCFAFWLPLVHYHLFARLGLGRGVAIGATLLSVGFLLADGNQHASQGNFAFVRLWQGKAVFFSLVLPLCLMELLAVMEGERGARLRLGLLALASAGLTGTAFFFLPLFVALYAAAWLLTNLHQSSAARPALIGFAWAMAVAAPLALVPLGLATHRLPMLQDFKVLRAGFSSRVAEGDWLQPLQYALGTPGHWPFYAALLVVPPLWASRRSQSGIIPAAFGLTLFGIFNPALGPLWARGLSEVYWRLLFLLPFAIGAGFAAVMVRDALARATPARERMIGGVCLVGLVALFAAHFQTTTLSAANHASWKSPGALRFDDEPLRFARSVREPLARAWIIAPEKIVEVLPLLAPDARFESHRAFLTLDAFAQAGALEEGQRRVAVMGFLGGQPVSGDVPTLLRPSLQNGFRAAIVVRERRDQLCRALETLGYLWKVIAEDDNYTAMRIQ